MAAVFGTDEQGRLEWRGCRAKLKIFLLGCTTITSARHVDRSWKIHPDLFMENARLSILGRITRAAIYGKVSVKRHLNMSGGMIHGNFH